MSGHWVETPGATYPAVVVEVSDEDGGGFMAYAPDLPGCLSGGQTDAEALQNLRLAIMEWCDEAERLGRRVPLPGSHARPLEPACIHGDDETIFIGVRK
jgi:antitoxin HicB